MKTTFDGGILLIELTDQELMDVPDPELVESVLMEYIRMHGLNEIFDGLLDKHMPGTTRTGQARISSRYDVYRACTVIWLSAPFRVGLPPGSIVELHPSG